MIRKMIGMVLLAVAISANGQVTKSGLARLVTASEIGSERIIDDRGNVRYIIDIAPQVEDSYPDDVTPEVEARVSGTHRPQFRMGFNRSTFLVGSETASLHI